MKRYQVEIGSPNYDIPIMDVDSYRAARALINQYTTCTWAYILRDGVRIRYYRMSNGRWYQANM